MPNQMPVEEKFDLVTHKTDPLTGKSHAVNLYTLHIIKGIRYFERPIHSGNLYYENNRPAGRLAFDAKGDYAINEKATHVAYVAPPTGAELIARELSEEKTARAQAEAELAAIKAERAPKSAKKED